MEIPSKDDARPLLRSRTTLTLTIVLSGFLLIGGIILVDIWIVERVSPAISRAVAGTLTAIGALLSFGLGFFATQLGATKGLFDPYWAARTTRKKYAIALQIASVELQQHMEHIRRQLSTGDHKARDALLKIPNNDFRGRIDWFTKRGYYTMATAYKIAVVSCWLQIYQRELLLSTFEKDREFISKLYNHADKVKQAFSTDTCLWYDYFDAVGSKLAERQDGILRPCSFATFCENYFFYEQYRRFYEQLHMFIWFIADGKYLPHIPRMTTALNELCERLKQERLLSGLEIGSPTVESEQIDDATLFSSPD